MRYCVFLTLQRGVFITQFMLNLHTKLVAPLILRMFGATLGHDSLVYGITGATMAAGLRLSQLAPSLPSHMAHAFLPSFFL